MSHALLILLALAAALALATFLIAVLWRIVLLLRGKPAPGYFRRALLWHLGLLALHAFGTVPAALGVLGARFVSTRGDEQRYRGPRIATDGTWLVQTRDTVIQEARGERGLDPDHRERLDAEAEALAVRLRADDGVETNAYFVPARGAPEVAPRFSAVLVHGLYRNALELEPAGAMLRELGGEVLLLELRNHGRSDRARPTFGRDEALDVLAAVGHLRARPDSPRRPLILFAVSLGTAAAALAAPRIDDLAGLILDAPIDDLRETARRLVGTGGGGRRGPGFPPPFGSIILAAAQWLGGVPFDEVRPAAALRGLDPAIPILVIGAGNDFRSPPPAVRALFEGLPTPPDRKKIWIDDDAEHGRVWFQSPDEYRRLLSWLVDAATGA